jgi:glucan biosynthesis protein
MKAMVPSGWRIRFDCFTSDNAYVMQTRRSTGDVKQSNLIRQPDGTIAFIVDFRG